jgi:F-type H+-transporting ATPase subunit g
MVPVNEQNLTAGYREPIVYNAKVAGSLLRQVYQAEKMAFPTSLSTWARAYAEVYHTATSGAFWKQVISKGTWAGVGVAVSCVRMRLGNGR